MAHLHPVRPTHSFGDCMTTFAAFAIVAVSTPLVAAVGDDAPAAKSPNRMICRHVNDRHSETRLGNRRTCHTAEDWRRLQEYGDPTGDQSSMFRDNREVADSFNRAHKPN